MRIPINLPFRGIRSLKKYGLQLSQIWGTTGIGARYSHGLSYISVPGEQPLLGLTIAQLLEETVQKFENFEAIVDKEKNIRKTFAQVNYDAEMLAEALIDTGFNKGDRIGIWAPNNYEWYITLLAAAKAGLILVNINPAYEGPEILYALNRVNMKGLVMAEEFRNRNYYDILTSVVPSLKEVQHGMPTKEVNSLVTVISMSNKSLKGTYSFEEMMFKGSKIHGSNRLKQLSSSIQMDNAFNIQFTSGTTGKPKGVILTHHNLVNNSKLISKRLGYTTKDKLCISVPFFHCYGLVGGILAGMHVGASCILPSPGFDPKKVNEAIEEERCTVLYGTPTMHIDIMGVPGKDLSSLRAALTAGSCCPEDVIRRMMERYGSKIVHLYGLTETSPVMFQTLPHDSDESRISTIGYPQEHTEVKVIDAEGNLVPRGVPGEVCTRGYMTMLGYWDEPQKTNEVLMDSGWFHTGDLFVIDENGYGRVVGRIKDMIIRGGENIYPREVEEFLHLHPKVMEAHVFGIPDERLGEAVATWISLKHGETMTEEELRTYSKGKIASFKIPKHIFFRDDFPKTASGKIQKFRMREETMKMLNIA